MAAEPAQSVVESFASRLRYPQLFFVLVALFLLDLFIPDMIPFADEVMLGLLAVLVGRLRTPRDEPERPPMKDVTPREGG
jgi:uncharacterized membrane protein YesL